MLILDFVTGLRNEPPVLRVHYQPDGTGSPGRPPRCGQRWVRRKTADASAHAVAMVVQSLKGHRVRKWQDVACFDGTAKEVRQLFDNPNGYYQTVSEYTPASRALRQMMNCGIQIVPGPPPMEKAKRESLRTQVARRHAIDRCRLAAVTNAQG